MPVFVVYPTPVRVLTNVIIEQVFVVGIAPIAPAFTWPPSRPAPFAQLKKVIFSLGGTI